MALLDKIKRNGVPLAGWREVQAYRGVTTGLNEAFLIDTATREALIRDDPTCAEIIKPYLRGQDVERWYARWDGLWMIFARRGIEIDRYPSVRRHLEGFRAKLEPKPDDWKPTFPDEKWQGRKEGQYCWYELQDPTDYWREFERPKIIYQEIAWSQTFMIDRNNVYLPNTAYLLTSENPWLIGVLNSPVCWWWCWRKAIHGKDEALRLIKEFLLTVSVPVAEPLAHEASATIVAAIERSKEAVVRGSVAIRDWLRHEFALEKSTRALSTPYMLDADGFVAAVRAALPKSRKWTAAEFARLKQEHASTIEPARVAAAEILTLERRLSDLVNAAYGLTPEDVALMWRTAPPRMPLDPAVELARMG